MRRLVCLSIFILIQAGSCKTAIEHDPIKKISGELVHLNCTLKTRGYCSWRKNGKIIFISKRYQYINGNTGKTVTDCSITIHNITLLDYGNWTCFLQIDGKERSGTELARYELEVINTITALASTTNASTISEIPVTSVDCSISDIHETSEASPIVFVGCLATTVTIIVFLCIYIWWQRKKSKSGLYNDKTTTENEHDCQWYNLPKINQQPIDANETSNECLLPMALTNNQNDDSLSNDYEEINYSLASSTANANEV
ncbi:hypothetical protein CHUAL_007660 [Chamberlinius hualienensis]